MQGSFSADEQYFESGIIILLKWSCYWCGKILKLRN